MNKCCLIKIILLLALKSINSSAVNRPPYFIVGTGDFSTFSIPENFQVGTSVYKLKGKITEIKFIQLCRYAALEPKKLK